MVREKSNRVQGGFSQRGSWLQWRWVYAGSQQHPCIPAAPLQQRLKPQCAWPVLRHCYGGTTAMHPFPHIPPHPYQHTSHLRSSNKNRLPCENMMPQCLFLSPESPGSLIHVLCFGSARWRAPCLQANHKLQIWFLCLDRNFPLT